MQCPHCLENFHDTWTSVCLGHDNEGCWVAAKTLCPACGRMVVTFGTSHVTLTPYQIYRDSNFVALPVLVRPKGISRAPLPAEVPEDFACDYREACLVFSDSEKASAALSRRCLQHVLREKAGVKRGDLANEIQQVLDSKNLPGHLAEDLDAVRNVGNFAAHPLKDTNTGEIVDVEPHEAEWLLNLLEGLFDFHFVQPVRAQARRDALNAKLQGAGKPPMKKP
jgi:Domain of unknown function (DUF4145)